MRRTRVGIAAIVGALLFGTASSLAATIVGTSRDDTLRGTPRADRLYGKAGNDTLVGRGGDDLLVGGPGADRLRCGSGRDVARADARDTVARDCETVRGLPPAPPPTTAGDYCGVTSQDLAVCLGVGTGAFGVQAVTRVSFSVQTSCEPPRQAVYVYALSTTAAVGSDRRFASRVSFSGLVATVEGTFAASRTSVSGSLRVQVVEDRSGVEYRCDSGIVSWSAETPPPTPSAEPGRFCGFTAQGPGLCFEVGGSPRTVSNLELAVRFECTPPATLGVSSTIPTAYAIRGDGSFSFTRTGTGTSADGGTFTVTHTLQGVFDSSGTRASGTVAAHLSYSRADGARYECDSGTFAWSAQRQ